MEWLFAAIFVIAVVVSIASSIAKSVEDQELLKRNPEAWKAKKQMEHEAKMMEEYGKQAEKQRRHQQVGWAIRVAQMFMR